MRAGCRLTAFHHPPQRCVPTAYSSLVARDAAPACTQASASVSHREVGSSPVLSAAMVACDTTTESHHALLCLHLRRCLPRLLCASTRAQRRRPPERIRRIARRAAKDKAGFVREWVRRGVKPVFKGKSESTRAAQHHQSRAQRVRCALDPVEGTLGSVTAAVAKTHVVVALLGRQVAGRMAA